MIKNIILVCQTALILVLVLWRWPAAEKERPLPGAPETQSPQVREGIRPQAAVERTPQNAQVQRSSTDARFDAFMDSYQSDKHLNERTRLQETAIELQYGAFADLIGLNGERRERFMSVLNAMFTETSDGSAAARKFGGSSVEGSAAAEPRLRALQAELQNLLSSSEQAKLKVFRAERGALTTAQATAGEMVSAGSPLDTAGYEAVARFFVSAQRSGFQDSEQLDRSLRDLEKHLDEMQRAVLLRRLDHERAKKDLMSAVGGRPK